MKWAVEPLTVILDGNLDITVKPLYVGAPYRAPPHNGKRFYLEGKNLPSSNF